MHQPASFIAGDDWLSRRHVPPLGSLQSGRHEVEMVYAGAARRVCVGSSRRRQNVDSVFLRNRLRCAGRVLV